jgi:hypothetical protein
MALMQRGRRTGLRVVELDEDDTALAARLFSDLGFAEGALMISRADVEVAIGLAREHGRRMAGAFAAGVRFCRVCGCTEFAACEGSCWWVGDDLCSSCEPFVQPARLSGDPS